MAIAGNAPTPAAKKGNSHLMGENLASRPRIAAPPPAALTGDASTPAMMAGARVLAGRKLLQ